MLDATVKGMAPDSFKNLHNSSMMATMQKKKGRRKRLTEKGQSVHIPTTQIQSPLDDQENIRSEVFDENNTSAEHVQNYNLPKGRPRGGSYIMINESSGRTPSQNYY